MFDSSFAMLFRAVDRIRVQLGTADADFRRVLAEELFCLQRLGEQYIDHWMALDEQIEELLATYELAPASEMAQPLVQAAVPPRVSTQLPVARLAPPSSGPDTKPNAVGDPNPVPIYPGDEFEWFTPQPDDAALCSFRKGMGYYDLLMFDDAAVAFEETVKTSPNPVARLYLAAAHAARGRTAMALAETQMVRNELSHPILLCAANEIEAQAFLSDGQLDQAILRLKEIIELEPDYQDVWYNLGICFAHQGDWAAAAMALARSLVTNPDDIDAVSALVHVHVKRRDGRTALETLMPTLAHHPRHVRLLYAHMQVLRCLGDSRAAMRVGRQILELAPDFDGAWSSLAWLLMESGSVSEGLALLKKQLTLRPQSVSASIQLGIGLMMAGDFVPSERVLTRVLPSAPDKSPIWLALGRVSAGLGHRQQASTRYLRAMRDPRKPVKRLALYYYGLLMYDDKRYLESEKYLRAASILGAPNSAMLTALGQVASKLGRTHEAKKLFQRASECI